MIHMRWVKYNFPSGISVTVLQYRAMTNIEEIGIQPPIWSEWRDIPTVLLPYTEARD